MGQAPCSVWAALDFYGFSKAYYRNVQDPYLVNEQPERFREAARHLPSDAVAGYVSDLQFEETAGSAAFFTAQYALAPRVLVPVAHPAARDWVVGNFSKAQDYAALGQKHQLVMFRDFGRGVVLFRKRAK